MKYDEFVKRANESRPRRKPRHIESSIQTACVSWFRLQYPNYLCFAIPNGGSRNRIEAAHLKREGAMAGVSDLIIITPNAVLFVEMKTAKGKQSEYQKEFEKRVTALGFEYKVCRSLQDFILTVEHFIKDKYSV